REPDGQPSPRTGNSMARPGGRSAAGSSDPAFIAGAGLRSVRVALPHSFQKPLASEVVCVRGRAAFGCARRAGAYLSLRCGPPGSFPTMTAAPEVHEYGTYGIRSSCYQRTRSNSSEKVDQRANQGI